jgi:xanthine dehydrogenase large subunit
VTLGAPLPHDAAPLHVTGQARYVDDLVLPGALHLAFALSPVAHGEIAGIDLAAARAAPGVVLVLTAADFAVVPDCSPSAHDEPLLAAGTVHYAGQPVVLVAADSHLAARRAARLAGIDVRERPAILTVDQALAAGARFEDAALVWTRGDAAAAIAAAPVVVAGRFEVGGQEHFYLEGQVAAAVPQEGGDMLVLSSTQHPTEVQHKVADALGLPMSAVRVETRRMGGGFGGKESQGNALAVACAVVAARTGRAARMRYDRDDDMTITGKRHDVAILYRAGADREGRLLGVEFTHLVRCGWSRDLSLPVADRAMLHADNCYWLPAVRIESHRLRTNTQSATAFRGFGGPQGMIGIERVVEHVAAAAGLDPLAVRRINFYRAAAAAAGGRPPDPRGISADEREGGTQTTPYGMPVEDFAADAIVAELERTSDFRARRAAIRGWNAASPILKRGIALTPVKFGISFTLTWYNQAGALVHVYQDGSVILNHGGTEMGQGLNQKVAQVTAAVFGLQAGAVKITATDTAKVPNTSATAASSGSDLNGMAAQDAARRIRDRIAAHLAERHQADPSEVVFAGGRVR